MERIVCGAEFVPNGCAVVIVVPLHGGNGGLVCSHYF